MAYGNYFFQTERDHNKLAVLNPNHKELSSREYEQHLLLKQYYGCKVCSVWTVSAGGDNNRVCRIVPDSNI